MNDDELDKLPEARLGQDSLHFGLADKQYLHQLAPAGFEIRQRPQLFKRLHMHILRFIDSDEQFFFLLGHLQDMVLK